LTPFFHCISDISSNDALEIITLEPGAMIGAKSGSVQNAAISLLKILISVHPSVVFKILYCYRDNQAQ